MEELIPAMEKALIDFSAGKVTQPVRSVITVDPPGGFFGLMPARTPEGLGLKIVTFVRALLPKSTPRAWSRLEGESFGRSGGEPARNIIDGDIVPRSRRGDISGGMSSGVS